MMKTNGKNGFTFIEVLLVIGALSLFIGIGAPVYQSFQNRNDLDTASESVVSSLRRAQVLSQSMEGDSTWGVHVATSTITVFKGNTYDTRDTSRDEIMSISGTISVTGTDEYVFSKQSGELGASATTTLTSVNKEGREIVVNTKGVVTTFVTVSTEGESSSPGIVHVVTITSDWDTGFCADVDVTTDSEEPITWEVLVDLGAYPVNGEPYNVWNATWSFANETLTASGVGWNDEVSASQSQQFGFCANRPTDPSDEEGNVEYAVAITVDWGTGYCANVDITTDSATPITWEVDIPLDTAPQNGTPYTVWNATWSFANETLTASGVGWNDEVSASQSQQFGYCANR